MPCTDGGPTQEQELAEQKAFLAHKRKMELNKSIACAALTFIEENDMADLFLRKINYKEQGFTSQELIDWWRDHKEEDKKRRIKEKQNIEKLEKKVELTKKKQVVLQKLTPDEIKLLGLSIITL